MSDDGSSSPRLVRDLMSVGVLTCSPETSVVELTRILLEKDLEAAVVLDDHGHAVGIVSRDDLVRAYASGDDVKDHTGAVKGDGRRSCVGRVINGG